VLRAANFGCSWHYAEAGITPTLTVARLDRSVGLDRSVVIHVILKVDSILYAL
jgi:hypothetical protein